VKAKVFPNLSKQRSAKALPIVGFGVNFLRVVLQVAIRHGVKYFGAQEVLATLDGILQTKHSRRLSD
jgi:hypothetical protein